MYIWCTQKSNLWIDFTSQYHGAPFTPYHNVFFSLATLSLFPTHRALSTPPSWPVRMSNQASPTSTMPCVELLPPPWSKTPTTTKSTAIPLQSPKAIDVVGGNDIWGSQICLAPMEEVSPNLSWRYWKTSTPTLMKMTTTEIDPNFVIRQVKVWCVDFRTTKIWFNIVNSNLTFWVTV